MTAATGQATRLDAGEVRRLLADLRAAGWQYSVGHEESGRDPDGAPEHEGWVVHQWRRGDVDIDLWVRFDGPGVDGGLNYRPSGDSSDHDDQATMGISLVRKVGAAGLRRIADALDLLAPAPPAADEIPPPLKV